MQLENSEMRLSASLYIIFWFLSAGKSELQSCCSLSVQTKWKWWKCRRAYSCCAADATSATRIKKDGLQQNVRNNKPVNKKVSQSLTGLKASCCHDESQTPSAMSVQSELGAETRRRSQLYAPQASLGRSRRPWEQQRLFFGLRESSGCQDLQPSWGNMLQSYWRQERSLSEFLSCFWWQKKHKVSCCSLGLNSHASVILLRLFTERLMGSGKSERTTCF